MVASAFIIPALAFAGIAQAHIAAFAKGMYCENGTDPANPNFNSNAPVSPLYQYTRDEWWFQHDRGCDAVPPPAGVFLDIPANGEFTVELANNQAFTTLSYGGNLVSDWPDGEDHPADFNGGGVGEGCIQEAGYMHVQDEEHATGTAFAIAYESDLSKITMEDLTVFTVLDHTPWHRLATYSVPDLPACPEGGCTCAWLWVPKGCGQPNMYMQGFKCRVTGATSTRPVAKAQPPTFCDGKPDACVVGAKQMIVYNQAEDDNTNPGNSVPAYNAKNGFAPGAQTDIFDGAASTPSSSSSVPVVVPSSSSSAAATSASATSVAVVVDPTTFATSTTSKVVVMPTTFATSTTSRAVVVPTSSAVASSANSATVTVSVTVTATATATYTPRGHHFKECWVEEVEE